jgi:putative peptide zinc metalloprotease protein
MPVARVGLSKVGALLWLLVVGFAVTQLLPMGPELKSAAQNSIKPHNWMYLWAVFAVIKLIHELGHAFSCRRFGGECHELGIMFLVFIPTPYVDASSAWGFPNKWHRIFVGAGGMIVELFVAAIIALFWIHMDKSTLIAQLCFNAMLVASVSTVIFNANPLLRYDGYYILSDWLEIPNLRQKSSEYALGLLKRHVFRVKLQQPLPPVGQRVWLFFYAIASSIYRVFVGFAIMMLVYFQIPVLGVLMALGGLVTWALVPIFKTTKYLLLEPELHRKRTRAIGFTLAVTAAVVILVGMVKFPVNIDQVGVIEPHKKEVIRGRSAGFVVTLGRHPDGRPLKDGDLVKKGQVLWVAEDKKLDAQIESYRSQVAQLDIELREATADDPLKRNVLIEQLQIANDQLAQALQQKDELTAVAPFDGQLIAPNMHEMNQRYLARGAEAAVVADTSQLEVVTLVEQRDSQQVLSAQHPKTEIRPSGTLATILYGTGIEDRGPAHDYAAHPALTQLGGEEIAIDPHDPSGKKLQTPQFELRVKLAADDARFVPGQKAYVRFKLDKAPLIEQWGRRFWQLIQKRESGAQWL